MQANTGLIEQDPKTGVPTVFPAFTELPDWLAEKIMDGNPDILVDQKKKPTAKEKKAAEDAKAKGQKGQPLASNTGQSKENPFMELEMAELEDRARAVKLDPDDYDTKEELAAALKDAGASLTVTPSPKPGQSVSDKDAIPQGTDGSKITAD